MRRRRPSATRAPRSCRRRFPRCAASRRRATSAAARRRPPALLSPRRPAALPSTRQELLLRGVELVLREHPGVEQLLELREPRDEVGRRRRGLRRWRRCRWHGCCLLRLELPDPVLLLLLVVGLVLLARRGSLPRLAGSVRGASDHRCTHQRPSPDERHSFLPIR